MIVEEGRVVAVKTRSGEMIEGDDFILAVPFQTVAELLPESIKNDPQFSGINEIEAAPISSVHLRFNQPITKLRHAVLVGRMSQWVFNRTLLSNTDENSFDYQVVISASRELKSLSQEEIQKHVLEDLKSVFPDAQNATLIAGRVITEHKAVFSVLPGVETKRPKQQTPIANLQLAGDWTNTGWPATMEGAVRSGYLAAENILSLHQISKQLIQPDLQTAWWTRLFFGNNS